eukprot:351703-Chlamydomonas_euryale.AAC.3
MLFDYEPLRGGDTHSITTGGGPISVLGEGSCWIQSTAPPGTLPTLMKLTNIAHAPACPVNLLSISRFNVANGFYLAVPTVATLIAPDGNTISTALQLNG